MLVVAAMSLSEGCAKGVFKELFKMEGETDGLAIEVSGLFTT